MVLIEVFLTTREIISSKHILFLYANPFTKSMALYSFLPPYSSFNMYTHLFSNYLLLANN
jgi:hypothetical protein